MTIDAPAPAPSAIQFTLKACCHDAPAGAGFVEVKGAPPALTTAGAATVVEDFHRPDYELDRPTAFHEAGHALAALVAGATVERVTLRAANPFARVRNLPAGAHAVFALAGPHAENLARGLIAPVSEAVVAQHVAIVSAPAGGHCDLCRAARACVAQAGLDNRDEAHRLFREAERATVRLLDHEFSRRFLRSVALELLRGGDVPGARVHEIADLVIDPKTLTELRNLIEMEK